MFTSANKVLRPAAFTETLRLTTYVDHTFNLSPLWTHWSATRRVQQVGATYTGIELSAICLILVSPERAMITDLHLLLNTQEGKYIPK